MGQLCRIVQVVLTIEPIEMVDVEKGPANSALDETVSNQ